MSFPTAAETGSTTPPPANRSLAMIDDLLSRAFTSQWTVCWKAWMPAHEARDEVKDQFIGAHISKDQLRAKLEALI